jgi:isopenicillin N synthase-like dioxygenase
VNHGVSATTIADLYAAASAFFYLSADASAKWRGHGRTRAAAITAMARRRWRGSAADRRRRDYKSSRSVRSICRTTPIMRGRRHIPHSRAEPVAVTAAGAAARDARLLAGNGRRLRGQCRRHPDALDQRLLGVDAASRRLSIPFFFQANYDTVVERLRQGETPKYPSVTVGAYRAERFAKTAG